MRATRGDHHVALARATTEVIGKSSLTPNQLELVLKILQFHDSAYISQQGKGAGKTTIRKIIARYFQILDEEESEDPWEPTPTLTRYRNWVAAMPYMDFSQSTLRNWWHARPEPHIRENTARPAFRCPVCSQPVNGIVRERVEVTVGPNDMGLPIDNFRRFVPGEAHYEPCGHTFTEAP